MGSPTTTKRQCEGCGGAIPDRMSRTRNSKGQLVCDSCISLNTPEWTAGLRYAQNMERDMTGEMRNRMLDAISSVGRVMRRTAHDSGDNAIINHCPFCGSGAVTGGGDGTVSCDFCHSNFTVQVQPAHPFMPQTVDGQPTPPAGLPGDEPTEMSAPLDPAVNETEEGVVDDEGVDPNGPAGGGPARPFGAGGATPKPGDAKKPGGNVPPQFQKGSALEPLQASYAAGGHALDEEAYMARLALSFADDRDAVLDSVRTRNVTAQSTVTCWHCDGSGDEPSDPGTECEVCHGTGLVPLKEAQRRMADLLNPASHIDENDRDLLSYSGGDSHWDEDLLSPPLKPVPATPVPPWLRDETTGGFYS